MIRNLVHPIASLALLSLLVSCAGTQKNFNPEKKYSALQLQQDVDAAWITLKKNHPSYDLFTQAKALDSIFNTVKSSITDSLTEAEFRLRLAYAVAAIRCGHTSVSASKAYIKFNRNKRFPEFPLFVKVWGPDSMVAIQTNIKGNTPIKRGTVITAIDSIAASVFIQQMKAYISTDGFSEGFKEMQISSSFPAKFRWMYGLSKAYKISYIDAAGNMQTTLIPLMDTIKTPPLKKTEKIGIPKPPAQPMAKTNKYGNFSFSKDSATAILTLNNFTHQKIPSLIKQSFKQVEKKEVKNLIIDLRLNGGGKIENSTLLTRYLVNQPFRVADSVSAKDLQLAFPEYTQHAWMYRYFRWAMAKKMEDGRWHMRHLEREVFKPKRKHHFSGNAYILTSGSTFSASTLLLSKIYQQPNVTIVGEETGGGARGNSAVFTPRVTLPNSKVRVRLPMFRIVSDASIPQNGRGFLPDVEVKPDSRSIEMGIDKKMEKVFEIIATKTVEK